jgi:two-component system chemotaxis sensor kinase CheA
MSAPTFSALDYAALLEVFLAESHEAVVAMEEALLALEAHVDDASQVQTLFRLTHTLKGNASSLGLSDLAELTHAMEDVLAPLREGALQANDEVVTVLLESTDVVRALVAEAGGAESAQGRHAPLLPRLRELAGGRDAVRATPALPAADAAPGRRATSGSEVRTLRVPVATLDRILDLTGEIAVARGRMATLLSEGEARQGEALEIHLESGRLHAELQELVMRMRMVPLAPTLARNTRLVRDTAAMLGKEARLILSGDDVEVDNKVVELIADPLAHLVRNAVAHGLESPQARRRAGKEACGTVLISATRLASSIVLNVQDDGAGLDRARILEIARRRSLVAGEDAHLSDAEVQRLIFEPGFSTNTAVDTVSGRGVGLDVVRRNVEALRGSITVTSVPGQGTTFSIRLPLTLAIIQGFSVAVDDEAFVVPLESVVSCLDLPVGGDGSRETGVIELHGEVVPFVRLRRRLGLGGPAPLRERALVIQHRERRVALVADALLGEGQAVIKPLGRMLQTLPGLAGSTIRGDGSVALLLDVATLVDSARSLSGVRNAGPESGMPTVPTNGARAASFNQVVTHQ